MFLGKIKSYSDTNYLGSYDQVASSVRSQFPHLYNEWPRDNYL